MTDYGRLHDRAVEVLRRYEDADVPFVLMLRTYRVRGLITESLYEDEPFDIQDQLARRIKHGVGVLSVKGKDAAALFLPSNRLQCPAFTVPDDQWMEVVGQLVERAAAIVCEMWFESSGFCWELEQCRRYGRQHETIILLDGPNGSYKIKDFHNVAGFNRIVLKETLPYISLLDHPCAFDLFEELYIKTLRLDAVKHFSKDHLALLNTGRGYVGFIQRVWPLADAYFKNGSREQALLYHQVIVNICAHFAERNSPVFEEEVSITARSALKCARLLCQLGDKLTAAERLELAKILRRTHAITGIDDEIGDAQRLLTSS